MKFFGKLFTFFWHFKLVMIYNSSMISYHLSYNSILPIVSISNMNIRKSSVANNLRRKYKRLVIPTAKFSWNWIKYFKFCIFNREQREVSIVNFCSWQFLSVRGCNAGERWNWEDGGRVELRLTMRVVFSCQFMHSST